MSSVNSYRDFALLQGDQAALPVLIQLLRDPSLQVRLVAADGLQRLGCEAEPAVATLLTLYDDPEGLVRRKVRLTLPFIDADAAAHADRRGR
ncbi:hypothetical protein AYO44_12140 [Planctomycetaceae bacterium SCGC AG-212-F19]|nr:hypothetical protein AYO44_12140 [Planctomycetaceae bacterium SCGC AG-212-F19]